MRLTNAQWSVDAITQLRYNQEQRGLFMPVICIANQKGGVGKTTTVAALAEGLSEHNKHVLLIDWDPQGSLTITMGFDPEDLKLTGYDVLAGTIQNKGNPSIQDVIVHTSNPNVDLIPANVELSQAELDLVEAFGRELVLKKMIQPVRGSYDFILVDCLPSLGLLTINALSASDQVLIPVQADFLAMKGLVLLLSTVIRVRDRINHVLEILGILFTMTNIRTLHSREVIEMTKRIFGDKIRIFETIVPSSVRFKEAPVAGQSIITYAPNSDGANVYRSLTREVMK